MSDVSGTQQEDAATIQEVVKPLAYGKLLMQKFIDLLVKKKRCDEELPSIQESPIMTFERNEETGFEWETISDKKFNNILHQSHIPILIVFYSSKVSLSYHNPSNEQSKRCVDVCNTFQTLVDV